MERRQALRYRMRLPVDLEHASGRTRDISGSGVFLETDQPFAIGQTLRFSVMLLHAYPGTLFRLHGEGSIVRVEERNGTTGVAIALSAIRLEPCERSLSSARP